MVKRTTSFLDALSSGQEEAKASEPSAASPEREAPRQSDDSSSSEGFFHKKEAPPKAKTTSGPSSNQVFFFTTLIFLSVCAACSVLAYRLGQREGYTRGFEYGLSRYSNKTLPSRSPVTAKNSFQPQAATQSPTPERTENPQSARPEPTAHALPSKPAELTEDQREALAPPEEQKKYTLQVAFMGPGHVAETRALVNKLKELGHDAFADYTKGIVYVGKFVRHNSDEAKKTQAEISALKWKNRKLDDCYFEKLVK